MYQKPKGTRDYYPEEKEVFNRIADSFRQSAKKYGFREVEAPAIETMDLLTAKQGDEIKSQIFILEKKGDEEFGLRPDITVPVTRMFIQKQFELPRPVKWFYITRMWRYERPQQGRLREFYQFGTEIYGPATPEADAEMISLAIDSLCSLGLKKKDFVVKINNRVLLQSLIEGIGIEKSSMDNVFRIIDKKAKISVEEFDIELGKIIDPAKIKEIKGILAIRSLSKIKKDTPGLENLQKVMDALKARKDFIELDLSTARGLAYYTGTVFEIFDRKGEFRSIAGGGRYDGLVQLLGSQKTPACGFGLGFATLTLLLEEKKLLPKINLGVEYYVAPASEKAIKKAAEIAEKLRKKGSVEIDLMDRGLGKQLDYANKTGAKNVVIIGDDELKKKIVKIKDMKTGREKKVSLSKFLKQ
ncbi:histidine--tRNA ligase [Candidatus Woesearchaeota archaeon CG10_big_fil_rev_8_21_14_0_10_44_13]|nr:MAG: histidine--tRNA ligase [Candidatus Woesearchaeota archaeon CG10_big_fil_rev_8_21_14_0_10_44_13]